MRYLVLGAAGRVAPVTVSSLLRYPDTEEVIIADLSGERLEELAERLKDPRLKIRPLDVRETGPLSVLMKEADVAVNSTWYEHNITVMKASLEASRPLVDLGGLYTMTRRQIEMDREVAQRGGFVLAGMGSDPGTSNVLCRRAWDMLQGLDEVHIRYGSATRGETFSFSVRTILDEAVLDAVIFEDGVLKKIPALSQPELVHFREPVGTQMTYAILHSELASVPFTLPGLRHMTYKDSWSDEILKIVASLKRLGLMQDEPVPLNGTQRSPRKTIADLIGATLREDPVYSSDSLKVTGRKREAGEIKEVVLEVIGHKRDDLNTSALANCTGVPPAIVARMVARGEVAGKGVFTPETCVPPGPFLRELLSFGFGVYESVGETRALDEACL